MAIEDWIALILVLNLSIYVNLGAVDFGARYLDLVTSGPKAELQRAGLSRHIGPIYAVNHILFLMVAGLLFVAFPITIELAMDALAIPVLVLFASVGLRCVSLLLRGRVGERAAQTGAWRVLFGVVSVLAPLALGMILGALASGKLRVDIRHHVVWAGPVSSWLSPFGLAFGGFLLSLGALAANTRVLTALGEGELTELFRRRALRCAVATGALAFMTFLLSGQGAPWLHDGLSNRWWSIPFQLITAAVAISAIFAIWRGNDALAGALVTGQITLVVWGWGLAMQPYLIYPDVSVTQASGRVAAVRFVLGALVVGTLLLFVSFWFPKGGATLQSPGGPSE